MTELKAIIEKMDKDAEQHGILGQKWGVRRAVNPSTGLVGGGKSASKSEAHNAAIKAAIRKTAGTLTGLRNDPRFKGKDLTKNPALQKQYDAEVKQQFKSALIKTATTTAISAVAGVHDLLVIHHLLKLGFDDFPLVIAGAKLLLDILHLLLLELRRVEVASAATAAAAAPTAEPATSTTAPAATSAGLGKD